ncbi:two-component sensor histidine kinase [Parabacteroides sp. An277]|uniref:sensor histidine kinase n=1 Tax=Parabacteroides sp. An277 TaxID=1965619 RepID=UPI000B379EBC|nr:HAMP domain-containing sensor histidine kinase [Parabacteroides sp. An277]OUO53181.1 two-component sensor histidine kinase [Parabacteroides sp. An277]
MKLHYRIIGRLSIALIFVLTVWAGLFYFALMDEVNDEVDDSLEDYSEVIITRKLAGEQLPSHNNGSNNQYYLQEVSETYADAHPHIAYADSMVFIKEKNETEPARILSTIFEDENDHYYLLTVSTPSIEKHDMILAIWYWIMFLYGALLLTILGINVWIYRRSMKPLYILLNWLDSYVLGKENRPLANPTDITEFQKLNEALRRSTEANERIYEQQKQFIGNASHEMQTPIAICRGRLEMLMEDESLTESQLEELAKIYETLDHITKLNKSLLLISKIENGQYPESSHIQLNALLRKYLPDYQEAYGYKQIQLDWEETGTLQVYMNETLAAILMTNLLKNAFVHTPARGNIRILIDNRQLEISNSAEDGALDREQIFNRFYQGSKKEHSTGLGLAIVATICRIYTYQIDYTYKENRHCFIFSCK